MCPVAWFCEDSSFFTGIGKGKLSSMIQSDKTSIVSINERNLIAELHGGFSLIFQLQPSQLAILFQACSMSPGRAHMLQEAQQRQARGNGFDNDQAGLSRATAQKDPVFQVVDSTRFVLDAVFSFKDPCGEFWHLSVQRYCNV